MAGNLTTELAEGKVNAKADELARQAADANRRARAGAEMLERFNGKRLADNKRLWCAYHRHLAAVHESLAGQHREALGRLIDGGRGGGS